MSTISQVGQTSTPSGMTGAGGGDMLRILGLNTGLDVDSIVEKMLTSDQVRINTEDSKLQKLQWKQEAYQDIIAEIKKLQDSYFNLTKMSSAVTNGSNYNVYKAVSADESIVMAVASSNAVEGNYTVNVINTAKKAMITGNKMEGIDASTKLSDLGITVSDKLTLKVDDTDSYNITFTDSDETVGNFLYKINSQTEGKVSGYFDEISQKITLQRNDTGSSHKIQVIGTDLSDKLTLTAGADSTDAGGTNANFTITSPFGESKSLSTETNDTTINGITFTLAGKENSTATVNVASDVDTTFNLIKGFIDSYNDLVDKVQGEVSFDEPLNKQYQPLTDAQKEQMTQDQIDKWNEQAKSGILQNDSLLIEMMDKLRNAFFDKINDMSLPFGRKIGLDTTDDHKKGGRIEFTQGGEDILKSVIRNNRSEITDLFTRESDSTDPKEKYNNEGIFQRIDDIFVEYVGRTGTYLNDGILSSIANKQNDYSETGIGGIGNTLPDQIYRQNQYIKQLTDRMSDDKEKYYKQFSALEVAMENLNAQSNWLYQQLA